MLELEGTVASSSGVAIVQSRVARVALAAAGAALVALGVLGIFLPLLPTTIFFIGATACFAKSSPSAHRWLTTNRIFGGYLRNYREHRGATVGTKTLSVVSLWLGIGGTLWFFGPPLWAEVILLAIAAAVTFHLLTLKTIRTPRR